MISYSSHECQKHVFDAVYIFIFFSIHLKNFLFFFVLPQASISGKKTKTYLHNDLAVCVLFMTIVWIIVITFYFRVSTNLPICLLVSKMFSLFWKYIHTPMAVAAMEGAHRHIRRCLGFNNLPKGALTHRPGDSNQQHLETRWWLHPWAQPTWKCTLLFFLWKKCSDEMLKFSAITCLQTALALTSSSPWTPGSVRRFCCVTLQALFTFRLCDQNTVTTFTTILIEVWADSLNIYSRECLVYELW